jgi:3-deoxy-7-phosphoheptulonate synthase
MIEVHPRPEDALCDGPQSLVPSRFMSLMEDIRKMALFLGRES